MHWLPVLIVLALACKKKQEPEPDPPPKAGAVGHSVTKIDESNDPSTETQPSQPSRPPVATAPKDAAAADPAVDGSRYGGNGSPAYRDPDGHVHGPGGPIFGGRGPDCTDKIDHCLREGVWFSVGKIVAGKLYRATPVFEFEGKYWNWIGNEEEVTNLYKTKVADAYDLKPGQPIIWFIEESSSPKWVNSEYEALNSSRWEAGIIDGVDGKTFRVKGWVAAVPVEFARVLVQRRGF